MREISPRRSIKEQASTSWLVFNYERGRQDFRDKRPRPPDPPQDGSVTLPIHAQWYGWMTERGVQWMKKRDERERVMRLLDVPDDGKEIEFEDF